MERTEGKKEIRTLKASFTVEAALLMGVILPVCVAIIMAGFYVHDRGVLQGMACETAAMGSNFASRKDGAVSKTAASISPHRLVWARNLSFSAAAGKDSVTASFSADFRGPGAIAALMTGGSIRLTGTWQRSICRPARLIWKIRGVKFLADALEE